jgi:hypothetical protein
MKLSEDVALTELESNGLILPLEVEVVDEDAEDDDLPDITGATEELESDEGTSESIRFKNKSSRGGIACAIIIGCSAMILLHANDLSLGLLPFVQWTGSGGVILGALPRRWSWFGFGVAMIFLSLRILKLHMNLLRGLLDWAKCSVLGPPSEGDVDMGQFEFSLAKALLVIGAYALGTICLGIGQLV